MPRASHRTPTGLEVVTEPRMTPEHRLPPDVRKERREDNRYIKKLHKKTRKRKKHGRQ